MDVKTEFFKLFWSELGTHTVTWCVPYITIFTKLISQTLDRTHIRHSYIGKCLSKLIPYAFVKLRCKVMFENNNTVWSFKNHNNNVHLPLVQHETLLNIAKQDNRVVSVVVQCCDATRSTFPCCIVLCVALFEIPVVCWKAPQAYRSIRFHKNRSSQMGEIGFGIFTFKGQ